VSSGRHSQVYPNKLILAIYIFHVYFSLPSDMVLKRVKSYGNMQAIVLNPG